MSLKNPLTPPVEEELVQFAQSVNKGNVPYTKEVAGTLKATRRAVGGLVGDTIGIATVPIESALNVIGYLGGAVSGTMYKTSHAIGSTRRGVKNLLQGKGEDTALAA